MEGSADSQDKTGETARASGAAPTSRKLDDVLLAMDVVDTLRHRRELILREMDAEAREEDLISRLKEIYAAQGIDVAESVLRDGVKALDESRFVYAPPEDNFQVRLARIYVARDRWLKPVATAVAGLVALVAVNHVAFVMPRQANARQAHIELAETLPLGLAKSLDLVQAHTTDAAALARADAIYREGERALTASDRKGAKAAIASLNMLADDLQTIYSVRIVSRPGEYSGLFRIPDDQPDQRNYYPVVEAVSPNGKVLTVPVFSEEAQAEKRVNIWG